MALPDFYSQFTQARQNGAQRADDYTVRQNIGGAVQGDSGALAAILKASPQTGMQVQQYAQGQKKLQQEDAGKAASMFAQTGDPQFYAMWKQSLAGLPNAPQLPDALEPDDIEPAKQSAMAFAQAYGGMAAGSNNVQSRFVGEDGQVYALMRNGSVQPLGIKADPNMQIIEGQGGYFGVNKRNLQANPVQVGQPATQAPPQGQIRYATSDGTAIPPDEQDEFQMAMQASARGQDVTIPVGGRPQFGGGQLQAAPKQAAQSELEKRLAIARQMGATPEDMKRMVVGGEAARDAQRISTADATKARIKLTQIQTARQQLQAAKAAFNKLKNTYSAGPGGQFLPTPEGQQFDRAIRNLSPLITAVTRVPGVGAMSDYESKLQESALPSRGTYEASTEQQIADLERLLDTVEGGYRDLLGEGSSKQGVPKPAASQSGGWSIKVKP